MAEVMHGVVVGALSTCWADGGGPAAGGTEKRNRSCLDILLKLSSFCSSVPVLEQVDKSNFKTL